MSWTLHVLADAVSPETVNQQLARSGARRLKDAPPAHNRPRETVWRSQEGHDVRVVQDHEFGCCVVAWTEEPAALRGLETLQLVDVFDASASPRASDRLWAVRRLPWVAPRWGPAHAEMVERFLDDPEEAVRRAALRAVLRRRWVEAAPLVQAAHPQTRERARQVLQRLRELG